ncbi:hypothetical protein N9C31_02485 [Gammaproteobacteria bacterium]|nr:hypothetical protein [Gammaproteobacteria bacterium]
MKKVYSVIFVFILALYLGAQYVVVNRLQHEVESVMGLPAHIKLGVQGLYLDLDDEHAPLSLKGHIYPSWHMLALKGHGQLSLDQAATHFHFQLDDFWDLAKIESWDQIMDLIHERQDQGRSLGQFGIDSDHLIWGGLKIDHLHAKIALKPGQESFRMNMKRLQVGQYDDVLAMNNISMNIKAPLLKWYSSLNPESEPSMIHANFIAQSAQVLKTGQPVLSMNQLNYDLNASTQESEAKLILRDTLSDFQIHDANTLSLIMNHAFGIDQDAINNALKLLQEEGVQNAQGLMNIVLKKSTESDWRDCLQKSCMGEISSKRDLHLKDLGVQTSNFVRLNLQDDLSIKIDFDRQFDALAHQAEFLRIHQKRLDAILESLMKMPEVGGPLSSMQKIIQDGLDQFTLIDRGTLIFKAPDRTKTQADFMQCMSHNDQCQNFWHNIHGDIEFSWIDGGRLQIKQPINNRFPITIKGLDGFSIKPAVTHVLKALSYEVTDPLMMQLVVDNGMSINYQAPGKWWINANPIDKLDLKPSYKQDNLSKHQQELL